MVVVGRTGSSVVKSSCVLERFANAVRPKLFGRWVARGNRPCVCVGTAIVVVGRSFMPHPLKSIPSQTIMKDSTRDKITGLAKQAKGRVESAAGELAGNFRLKAKGAADQAAGEVQKRIGDLKKARGR
jgi:uncharacterized protein YjbJ (UPF0337 family)